MLCAQVVANEGHAVAVDLHAAALDLFGDEGTYGVVNESFVLDEKVDDGAFARTEGASYAYGNHCLIA